MYILSKETLQFLSLKSAVYDQEGFQIKRGFKLRGVGYNLQTPKDSLSQTKTFCIHSAVINPEMFGPNVADKVAPALAKILDGISSGSVYFQHTFFTAPCLCPLWIK